MISNFILWTAENLENVQSITNRLFSFLIWGFIGILIYWIIKLIYDICKKWSKKAFKNLWKFIWLPLIAFAFWLVSWTIIAFYFYFLSQIIPFDATITEETNQVLYSYASMAALYNLIFILIWCILVEFSFKNKIICWTWIIIWLIGFIFPLIASILCMP